MMLELLRLLNVKQVTSVLRDKIKQILMFALEDTIVQSAHKSPFHVLQVTIVKIHKWMITMASNVQLDISVLTVMISR